eukprot:2766559-Rhodomonas_salina.2
MVAGGGSADGRLGGALLCLRPLHGRLQQQEGAVLSLSLSLALALSLVNVALCGSLSVSLWLWLVLGGPLSSSSLPPPRFLLSSSVLLSFACSLLLSSGVLQCAVLMDGA